MGQQPPLLLFLFLSSLGLDVGVCVCIYTWYLYLQRHVRGRCSIVRKRVAACSSIKKRVDDCQSRAPPPPYMRQCTVVDKTSSFSLCLLPSSVRGYIDSLSRIFFFDFIYESVTFYVFVWTLCCCFASVRSLFVLFFVRL